MEAMRAQHLEYLVGVGLAVMVGLLFLGSASFMVIGVIRFFWETASSILQPTSAWNPWSIVRLAVVLAIIGALTVAARAYRKG